MPRAYDRVFRPGFRPEIGVRPGCGAGYAAGVTDGDAVDWRGLNRANWDERVPVHLASELYDLEGFRAGASSLRPFEAAEAGEVIRNTRPGTTGLNRLRDRDY